MQSWASRPAQARRRRVPGLRRDPDCRRRLDHDRRYRAQRARNPRPAQRARRRDYRLGEPPRQRRRDLKTRRSSNRVPCSAACPALDRRARRSRGQRDRLTRHPGHRHGHIPPAHARDQPGSARHPVAGLKEQNDLLDGPVGPARLPLPRPHREIPSWPRLALTLYATPATGSVICGMAKIWRKAWISSASRMSRNWPAAVLTMAGRPRWRWCRLWVSSRPVEVRLHGVEARTSRHSGISPFRGKTVWRVAMMARSTGSAGS